jgi:hypothetical protein
MLSFLMEQRDLKASDLIGIFSSEQAVEDGIEGKVNNRSIDNRSTEAFSI